MDTKRGTIEIVLQKRDGVGNPTGKTVYHSAGNGGAISDFYEKNKFVKPKKKRKKTK